MPSYQSVWARFAPWWELDRLVAVNPWEGLTARSFRTILYEEEARTGYPHLPGAAPAPAPGAQGPGGPRSLADLLGPFLASYFSPESSVVPAPWGHLPLYEAWVSSLPTSLGLPRRSTRTLVALVKSLPRRPSQVLEALAPEPEGLAALLDGVRGWASLARRREWPGSPTPDGPLAALGALVAVVNRGCPMTGGSPAAPPESFDQRFQALEEREEAVRRWVVDQCQAPSPPQAPKLRAAFCIDVRSEPFRRHWEAVDPDVETDGVAGFFGLPLGWAEGSDLVPHLPVLGSPSVTLGGPPEPQTPGVPLPHVGVPHFPLVEWTGWQALGDLLGWRKRSQAPVRYPGIEASIQAQAPDQKVAWALGLVEALGWRAPWAPVYMLVGHGSTSTNNAQGSSLQCGACGGQSGEASVRAMAAVLNDPETRQGLEREGVVLPTITRFVPALHDTTTDRVTFWGDLPPGEPGFWERRLLGLAEASRRTQAERQARFPFLGRTGQHRALDPAEVRPEAGLAGNAVFLAVPRGWTRGANLGGRAFIHTYDPSTDPDGSVLERILTGPVVVASWINLQYWASTTVPQLYGAGAKVLHSRIGTLGVFEGLGGDLKTGLPWESVAFDGRGYHEPLRLQVMVAASRDRIHAILRGRPGLRPLVDGQWIRLFLDHEGTWEPWEVPGGSG